MKKQTFENNTNEKVNPGANNEDYNTPPPGNNTFGNQPGWKFTFSEPGK